MPLLVVLGINGRQGASVARAFLNSPGWRIRGLTSSTDCLSSQQWQASSVEVLQINLNNDEEVRMAFKGATAIFAVTDFYSFLNNRSVKTLAGLRQEKVEKIAGSLELIRGRTILDAAANVIGLQRLILSTLPLLSESEKAPNAKGSYHFTAKADTKIYLRCFPDLEAKTSLLKPCLRMEEYRMTLRKNDNGTLSFGTTAAEETRLPWINVKEDFGTIARALVLAPPEHYIAAVSDWRSGKELCDIINEISGLKCYYRRYTASEMERCRGHIMADLMDCTADCEFFEPNVFGPERLEYLHNARFQQTSFADYLKQDLPIYLEELMSPPDTAIMRIFASRHNPNKEEMEGMSDKLREHGYVAPKVNHNGHDRSIFVGNHQIVEK